MIQKWNTKAKSRGEKNGGNGATTWDSQLTAEAGTSEAWNAPSMRIRREIISKTTSWKES